MRRVLVETSAWEEFDRGTGSAVDQALTRLVEEGGPLAVTEPVVMEVCPGARCRAAGVTPRGLLDCCLIASVALRHGARVLSWERDLAHLAGVVDLELHPASLR